MNNKSIKLYTALSDKQLQDIKQIDKDIENGIVRQTFYRGWLYKSSNGVWYEFLTNISTKKRRHIETVLANLSRPIDFVINDEAIDVNDNIIPDCFSLWVPVNTVPGYLIDQFFELSYALSSKYRELLLQCGVSTDDIKAPNSIYLGCEKDLWPDKPWLTEKIHKLTSKKNS